METFILINISLVIISVFVVFLTLIFAALLWYIIPILKNVNEVCELAKQEGEKIVNDIDSMRETLKKGEAGAKSLFSYVISLFLKRQNKKSKK